MLAWMQSFGEVTRVGVECAGTYGADLVRYLQQSGIQVLEVTAPDKADRRKRGKDDQIDAQNAVHASAVESINRNDEVSCRIAQQSSFPIDKSEQSEESNIFNSSTKNSNSKTITKDVSVFRLIYIVVSVPKIITDTATDTRFAILSIWK